MSLESLLGGPLSRWRESWDGSSIAVVPAAAAVLLVLTTYAVTSLKAAWIKNVRGSGDPPTVPYAVPVLANTFQFAYDTESFLKRAL